MSITNERLRNHPFLKAMYGDAYFPAFLVDKGKAILVQLCEDIEAARPTNDAGLLRLTHPATDKFNELAGEFEENDSELETGAREAIGGDFDFIAKAYGFDVDVEDLIAPRDW